MIIVNKNTEARNKTKIKLNVKSEIDITKNKFISIDYEQYGKLIDILDRNINEDYILSYYKIDIFKTIDFYTYENKLYQDTPIKELHIIEFINIYPELKEEIPVLVDYYPIDCTGKEFIDFIKDIYDVINSFMINRPLAVLIMGCTFKQVKKQIIICKTKWKN